MRLKAILDIYHKELDRIYGAQEVDAFFNLLIAHFLEIKRLHLVLDPEYAVDHSQEQVLFESLNALKQQRPIQYILGETEFYGLPFQLNEATLIPRPETEELVEWVISDVNNEGGNLQQILDVGTGSGCIAIALAYHLNATVVSAIDISQKALEMAVSNAKLNGVKVAFAQVDILNDKASLHHLPTSSFDIIVSNPPYVRQQEKVQMKPNVLDYEPHDALFVDDENPLKFYDAICAFSQVHLKKGGALYFEINEYLGSEMEALLRQHHFHHIVLKKDIFGKNRMIKGVKSV